MATKHVRKHDPRNLRLKRVVDAIGPGPVRYMVWDASEPGFGIDVWPSGKRSWILFYRVHGLQRRIKLGDVGVLPPERARELAQQAKREVSADRDPLLERRAKTAAAVEGRSATARAATFSTVADRYVETLQLKRSARWAKEARRLLDREILPTLGAVPIAAVTVRHVEHLHHAMHDRPFLANRCKAVVSAVLATALRHGDRPREAGNPATMVEAYDEPERKRILSAAEWRALARAWPFLQDELAGAPAWDTRREQLDAIAMIALTGARVGAITARRVGDVDVDSRTIAVRPAHKRVSRIFLGTAALTLATRLTKGRAASAYLFPGQERREGPTPETGGRDARPRRAAAPITGPAKAWARLRELAGLADFAVEDFRGCFASIGAELGYSTFVIGGVLGHSAKGVTERHYAARPDELLLTCADAVSAEVARRLGFAKAAKGTKRATRTR